jgi:hypothetical protein
VGYEPHMQSDILGLLGLFRGYAPDPETIELVIDRAVDRDTKQAAHDLFHRARTRNLSAIKSGNHFRVRQYCFRRGLPPKSIQPSGRPIPTRGLTWDNTLGSGKFSTALSIESPDPA